MNAIILVENVWKGVVGIQLDGKTMDFDRIQKRLKRHVSLSLDIDIVEKAKQLADENDRSFSQYVNIILKKVLERHSLDEEGE